MKVYDQLRTRSWQVIHNEKTYVVEHFENFQTDYSNWEVFDHKERKVHNPELENEILKTIKLRINEE